MLLKDTQASERIGSMQGKPEIGKPKQLVDTLAMVRAQYIGLTAPPRLTYRKQEWTGGKCFLDRFLTAWFPCHAKVIITAKR